MPIFLDLRDLGLVAMLEREREEKNIKKIIIRARIFGLFFSCLYMIVF